MKQAQNHNLKIVMAVANNTYPADPRVRREALTLVDAGYKVTVIAPRGENEDSYEIVNGVTVLRYAAPPEGKGVLAYTFEFLYVTFFTALYVARELSHNALDVLHLHNPPDTLFLAGLLPKLFGKTVIYDHHDLAPELYLTKFQKSGGWIHRILLLLEKWTCKIADYVITVNESYKASDMDRNGVAENRITVVRNAPTLQSLEQTDYDEDLKNCADIIVGYLGHIAKQDGVDHMLKALHYAQQECGFSSWYAIIIGPGDELVLLEKLADELGIADKICFTGFLPPEEWRVKLNSADICFVPDPSNPLNEKSTMMKMMDYMALGKPIVAYDMTENRVSGGEATLYAEANNFRDLGHQFMRLVENPELRESLGEIGKKRMYDQLAWHYSAENLIGLYDQIFTQNKKAVKERKLYE